MSQVIAGIYKGRRTGVTAVIDGSVGADVKARENVARLSRLQTTPHARSSKLTCLWIEVSMIRVISLSIAFLLIALVASAQVTTGSIIGIAKDESGGALPGVTATVASPALPGGIVTLSTGPAGDYRFVALPPGVYSLTLALQGFATYQEQELRVTANSTLERNVTMKVSALQETVTVTGESPMVDVRQVAVAHTVDKELVENIPNQRYSVQEYAKWIPGVSAGDPSARSQAITVFGVGVNDYQIDGQTTTTNGGYTQGSDVDSIQEVQVSTVGASAEYAAADGGVFNMISKSGTNTFAGSASINVQPDNLISKPIRLACNCPAGTTGFTRKGYHDYSFHAGGPIIKDRLWYFAGGVIWERRESAPGINPAFSAFDQDNKYSSKITLRVNDRLRINQILNNEPANTPGRPSLTAPASVLTDGWVHPGIRTYATEVTAQLSNNTVLTIRQGGTGYAAQSQKPKLGDYTTPNHTDAATGIQSGGVRQFQNTTLWRRTAAIKLNRYVPSQKVGHDIRGGAQFDWDQTHVESAFPSGVQYSDLNSAPDQATYQSTPTVSGGKYHSYAFWGEDQMTLRNRFTVSVGVRYDSMHAVSQDLAGVDLLLKPNGTTVNGLGDLFTWNVVSPRLGFNLKLTDDGKTVMRGTYGRPFRQINLGDFTNIHPGISPTTLKRYDPATRDYTTLVSVTDPRANIGLDPNIKAPYTDAFSIGVDRQLTTTIAVSGSYVHKNSQNLIGWIDRGGIYQTINSALPDGRTIAVQSLVNSPSARKFIRTNGPGFFVHYNGLVLSATKRLSNHWQTEVSYTESRTVGLSPTGTVGQDPNDLVNLTGRLAADRPHMFQTQSMVQVPKVGLLVAANFQSVAGIPYAPQALINLPQGRRSINIAAPGSDSFRAPWQNLLGVRFSKPVRLGGSRKLELIANVYNVLQVEPYQTFVTLNYFTPQFAQPAAWVEPRNMTLMAKFSW